MSGSLFDLELQAAQTRLRELVHRLRESGPAGVTEDLGKLTPAESLALNIVAVAAVAYPRSDRELGIRPDPH